MTDAAIGGPRGLVRPLADAAPAVGFLAVLIATRSFPAATVALMLLSVAALAAGLIIERRLAPVPAFSGAAALLFGGLSLALHRNDLMQMKMTIVDGLLGAALLGGLATGRNPLKALFSTALSLPDRAWRVLSLRYAIFFWCSALANEVVRRTQSADVWATFRVVAIFAALLFGVAQFPFLKRHCAAGEAEPPETGF
jgi:intracellular septation protein